MSTTSVPSPGTAASGCAFGTVAAPGGVIDDGAVCWENGVVTFVGEASAAPASGGPAVPLPAGALLLPGLVDLHCHGAVGVDFSTASAAEARRAAAHLHRSGTTTFLASVVAGPPRRMAAAFRTLAPLAAEGLIAGLHAEGPFLSARRCGAQDPAFLIDPDPAVLEELLEAADGTLATMTYAPELPGADALVRALAAAGVVPSPGHTEADDATAAASLAAARRELAAAAPGARPTVTHLFNGMAPLHHRVPGPAGACLRAAAAGEAVVELIADGVHLDPAIVHTVFALAGAENVALVSDSMAAAGLGDGSYLLGSSRVTVQGGRAVLADGGSLAGGTSTVLDGVRTALDAGVGLCRAVAAASSVPAAVLGLGDVVGALRPGLRADLVAVTAGLEPLAVVRGGRVQA